MVGGLCQPGDVIWECFRQLVQDTGIVSVSRPRPHVVFPYECRAIAQPWKRAFSSMSRSNISNDMPFFRRH